MNRKTATQIRADRIDRDRVFTTLCVCRHLQSEAIARHYIAHAEIALEITRMLEAKKQSVLPTPDMDRAIEMCIEQIKTNHLHDLGIALEWEKDHQPEWLNQALNEGDGTYKP